MPFCSNCGYKIEENDNFCKRCGNQLNSNHYNMNPNDDSNTNQIVLDNNTYNQNNMNIEIENQQISARRYIIISAVLFVFATFTILFFNYSKSGISLNPIVIIPCVGMYISSILTFRYTKNINLNRIVISSYILNMILNFVFSFFALGYIILFLMFLSMTFIFKAGDNLNSNKRNLVNKKKIDYSSSDETLSLQMEPKESKNMVTEIIMWVCSIIITISGLGNMSTGNFGVGILFIIIGITLCPLIKMKKSVRIIIIVVCLLMVAGSDNIDSSNISN